MSKQLGPRSWNRGERMYFSLLQDELIICVLSRLPTEDVIRYRQVCRNWRDLISTQYFLHIHMLNQGTSRHPLIIVNAYKNGTLQEFILHKWWESETTSSLGSKMLKLSKYPGYRPYRYATHHCCGNGFVVLKSESNFTVFNPIYHNKVTITFPESLFERIQAFAIYFHPTLKQNCILWVVHWPSYWLQHGLFDLDGRKGYAILILGPNPCWRNIISNPWIDNANNPNKPAVLAEDKYLYWLVKHDVGQFDIMEFDIISEELKVIGSSLELCQGSNIHMLDDNNNNISLLNVNGILSLFLISPTEKRVYQWTLTDRVSGQWTNCIYSITDMCQFDKPIRAFDLISDTGDLLIESDKMCVFNIKLGTMRKLTKRTVNGYSVNSFMSHVITCASLGSCKSNICLGMSNTTTLLESMEPMDFKKHGDYKHQSPVICRGKITPSVPN